MPSSQNLSSSLLPVTETQEFPKRNLLSKNKNDVDLPSIRSLVTKKDSLIL